MIAALSFPLDGARSVLENTWNVRLMSRPSKKRRSRCQNDGRVAYFQNELYNYINVSLVSSKHLPLSIAPSQFYNGQYR